MHEPEHHPGYFVIRAVGLVGDVGPTVCQCQELGTGGEPLKEEAPRREVELPLSGLFDAERIQL